MNLDPMKCVAYGAGILAQRLGDSIECPKCKTINPSSASVCINEQCKESLSGDLIYGITGMHIGIQTEGDIFRVIIPKGSSYPTFEPIVETFHTPVANMRRIKVPVYQGENEIASKNDKMLTVWLEVPENVPADIPVDVSFKLDENMILEHIKVSIKDGSGREIEVFPDRGGDERSKLENEIEEMNLRWNEKRKDASDDVNKNMDQIYSEATNAANKNNMDAVKKKLEEMKKIINKIGGEKPEWVQKAEGLSGYSNFILDQYGWLLDPQQSFDVKKLIEELKDAIEKDNKELGLKKYDELNKKVDELPRLVGMLMYIVMGIMKAQELNKLMEADTLRNLLREIEDAIKKNTSPDVINNKIEEALRLSEQMLGTRASGVSSSGAIIYRELLKK
jgi:hypothetical protein